MSAGELQFRTSAIGGFHKQDVLDYIDRANREHLERLDALRRELDESSKARAALEEEKGESERQLAELRDQAERQVGELKACREEAETLRRAGEEARRSAEAARAELDAMRERLSQAEAQLAQAQARIARAEPAARAYESLKDRTAGIELEAYHRAQGIQVDAEEQAARTREETGQWLDQVQERYAGARADLEHTVAQTTGELERVRRALEGLSGEFARQNEIFNGIVASFREEGPRMPDPLPLEEQPE